MTEIKSSPGREVIDSAETPRTAYRLLRAVMENNAYHPDAQATFGIYTTRDGAQPPIEGPDAAPGEVYTRMESHRDTLDLIMHTAMRLSHADTPPTLPID